MSLINSTAIPSGATAYEIEQSLRFNDDDTAYLDSTFTIVLVIEELGLLVFGLSVEIQVVQTTQLIKMSILMLIMIDLL